MNCFTCGNQATHRSKHTTPTGEYAYQCDAHAQDQLTLWGSDPGWPTIYERIQQPEQLPLPLPATEQRSTTPTVVGIRAQLIEAAQHHHYPLFFELSALCARIGNKERK